MLFGPGAVKKPAEDDPYADFDYGMGENRPPGTAAYGMGGVPGTAIKPTTAFRAAPGTAFGRGGRLNTGQARGVQQYVPLGTAAGPAADPGGARPMTSVSGAGYNSGQRSAAGSRPFDPLNQASRGAAPPLAEKKDNSPEDLARDMENQVHRLLEASADAAAKKDVGGALEKAKDAGKKERALCRHRETNGLSDHINLDLTYAVCLNLAYCYHLNHMHDEALHTYQLMVKNKQYPAAGRLRVNMGNIYFEQKKYPNAIKMYRMALDQVPNTSKELRFKIFRNIGQAFVRLGQFQDAIQSFETVMGGNPEFQTGFNLMLCYFALGDSEKMKRGFSRLITIPIPGMAEDEDDDEGEGKEKDEAIKLDALKQDTRRRHKEAAALILNAAKLVAPAVDKKDWNVGFKWVVDSLRADHEHIASQIEIEWALYHLRAKAWDKAVDLLKAFEKKDAHLRAMAANNLSFIYFLEHDQAQAEKYADLAIRQDRYNAMALVNKGNCLFVKNEFGKAKELYLEAIGVEADCVEAIFNLGLVNLKLGALADAQQAYEKLHTIIPNSPEVMFQIGHLCEEQGNLRNAAKWFSLLCTRVSTDPTVLARLGQIYSKEQDESQAFHYHLESYRHYPVNLDVISWLGVWYVKSELYEKAIHFFVRASQIQPTEVKWRLMVTSCYRRLGNYSKALELYEEIHAEHPDNVECLKYLVALCKDLGRPYDQYQQLLSRLDASQARVAMTRQQQQGGALTRVGPQGGMQPPQVDVQAPAPSGRSMLQSPSGAGLPPQQRPPHDDGAHTPPPMPRGKQVGHAERAAPAAGGRMEREREAKEEDDFGDADVNELLA